jgi:psp operon transcriptional activator
VGFATNSRSNFDGKIVERADQFIGQSLAFLDAVERASRAAPLNRPVLVIGERGTGKELIAERLHHLSSRWAGPLIIMNCAALPENLIEAELFGHEAGSFTGAAKTRHGRFEEADGGTLFLDELGTLSMPAQDRLLRATEYGEITRIGASRPISVDVRIVAATNENLPAQVDKGRFRADLLDRLSFEVITLPPLRAREGDIPLLAEHFGRRMAVELDWPNWPGFTPRAVADLESYAWPGNVRELRNVVERAVYRHEDPERAIDEINFDPFHSPWAPTGGRPAAVAAPEVSTEEPAPHPAAPVSTSDFRAAVSDYERQLLEEALRRNRFNQRATAAALNLSYDQLRHALKRHKLQDSAA